MSRNRPRHRLERAAVDRTDRSVVRELSIALASPDCGRLGELAGRDGDRLSEACALELRHPPVRIGAQFGREGVQGFERALDRGAVWDRL